MSEANTEAFYDSEDSLYRSFWDSEGSLHWGYFENLTEAKSENLIIACKRWNEYMLSQSGTGKDSRVLDLGCDNGNTAIWLSQHTGCQVVGVDLSGVRIENAKTKAQQYRSLRVKFIKASATNLPFEDKGLTHVWSQATLYHVHDRHQALRSAYRVLEEGGIFVFDDLITPIQKINEYSQKLLLIFNSSIQTLNIIIIEHKKFRTRP
ncbi:MAG: class I SAM-dependent methyltransferase [Trichodesmium sp. MAG_R03]|nr:class I SAM-dependent methyltransferase [Trichodesmium sp. MAG_R03]